MRSDIRRAFDEMLPAPHPALQSLVRARLQAIRNRRENVVLQRMVQFGAAAAAILVLGVVAFSLLFTTGHRGTPQHGPAPVVGGSPSPSPTANRPAAPLCSGTYTFDGSVVTLTVVEDRPGEVIAFATDQSGLLQQWRATIHNGETTAQLKLPIGHPPIVRVEFTLNTPQRNNQICVATPAG